MRTWCVALVASGAFACSSQQKTGFSPSSTEAGSDAGFSLDDAGTAAQGCMGLACKRPTCTAGARTTIRGRVLDPAGKNPLYNVIAYVPNKPLEPLAQGASCDRCGAVVSNPVTSALTNERGEFVLPDAPADVDVPVVIQVGKWRRVFKRTIDACKETGMGDLTLPKNGGEGVMPQIAVTTGQADALECLLRGIGVDDAEFVPGAGGSGHVHLWNGAGGVGMPGTPDAQPMWNDTHALSKYDVVLLSCEGEEHNENKSNMAALQDYANAGGRVFATHFHYTWFKNGPGNDFRNVANWGLGGGDGAYDVDQSFPKGKAFASWLVAVGASTQKGLVTLSEVRSSVTSVNSPTQGWLSKGSQAVSYFSFNTPIRTTPDQQCGRTVFGDLHVSGEQRGGQAFPDGCAARGADMTPEQKAMEFMFFDVSSCVQNDQDVPQPPR